MVAIDLPVNKKIYFASDFHLGAPTEEQSKIREKKIVAWLEEIQQDAAVIFLVGDIFDFWFEYKYTIPKSFLRFQSKLLQLIEKGISIHFFTGNHDMWMFDYFTNELGIPIHRKPISLNTKNAKFHIAHGDGLGPNDHFYKFLKNIFTNKFFQGVFRWVHPNIGFWVATTWSNKSRLSHIDKEDPSRGEKEWTFIYSKEIEQTSHHDYYVYGHRHVPMEMDLSPTSKYFNLGEWVTQYTYLEYDGIEAKLKTFT